MKRLFLFCGLLLGLLPLQAVASDISPTTDSLLTELNRALAHKKEYDGQRLNRIAVLTADYASPEISDNTRFDLGLRIYDEYKAFKYDSAFVYCQKIMRLAGQLKSPEKMEVARLKLAFVLLSSGLFKETFETLDGIRPRRLSPADRQSFYFLKARAYSDLGDFNQDQTYRPALLRPGPAPTPIRPCSSASRAPTSSCRCRSFGPRKPTIWPPVRPCTPAFGACRTSRCTSWP